jgi:hypothetical protein
MGNIAVQVVGVTALLHLFPFVFALTLFSVFNRQGLQSVGRGSIIGTTITQRPLVLSQTRTWIYGLEYTNASDYYHAPHLWFWDYSPEYVEDPIFPDSLRRWFDSKDCSIWRLCISVM